MAASVRGLRKSSRMSSPANLTTTPKGKDDSPGEAIQVKSDGKTFLDNWVEPPLRAPAPSFEDYKGLERHGVLEKMLPLGEKPTPKNLQRLKLLPSKANRQSTPISTEEEYVPTNGISSRADTISPADDSPRSLSFEPDDMITRRAAKQATASAVPPAPAVPEAPRMQTPEQSTEISQPVDSRSPPPSSHTSLRGGRPSPTPVQNTYSFQSGTPQQQYGSPTRPKEQLQRVLSAALAESDWKRDHVATLGLRNFWTENTNRPEILSIFSNILDGTARKHEKKIFNRFILNAKEFLRHAPTDPYAHSHPQAGRTSQFPGTSKSGRMNGTIIEFTTPIVSQPPRQHHQRRSGTAAPSTPASARTSEAPSVAAPTAQSPAQPISKPVPFSATNGVKRKREDEELTQEEEIRNSTRSRSLSSVSSLSEAKSMDDEMYASEAQIGGQSEGEGEGENDGEVRIIGDAAVAATESDKGGDANFKPRPPSETNEKSRQVPSRSAARTANNNLATSLRRSTHQAKKPKPDDTAHEAFPPFQNNEKSNWTDRKEKLEQGTYRYPTTKDKVNLRGLNPPSKKDAKIHRSTTAPLTEEEQRRVDEERQALSNNSYSIRDQDFPESSLRSPTSSTPLSPPSESVFNSPRATPKPDIKVHHLSRVDAQLVSSPVEAPSIPRELRNGSTRKRSRNEFEEQEDSQTPAPASLAENAIALQRSKDSRAGTPRASAKIVRRLDLKKSARVIQSPQKKTGITAGMPRNVGAKQNGYGDGVATDESDNDEECSACGGAGELICCDGCPHAFHFSCADPPLKSVPEGLWYCSRCAAERNPGQAELGVFNKVVKYYDEELPISYSLPKQLQDYWDGVRRGSSGEYEEYAEPKTQDTFRLNRAGLVEIPDPKRLREKDGSLLVCHRCKRTASNSRELVSCDYCPTKWHMECVDHPMPIPPRRRPGDKAGSTWRCPLHADDIISDINAKSKYDEAIRLTGRLPKIRKPRRALPYEPDQRRGYRNNGNILIALEDEEDPSFKTVDWMGQQVRLSEKAIKFDFIDRARTMRIQERLIAAQIGVPRANSYTPGAIGRIPRSTRNHTPLASPTQSSFPKLTDEERELADVLLGISRATPESVSASDWQDTLLFEASSLIRGAHTDEDEEHTLLKLQSLLDDRLTSLSKKKKERKAPSPTPAISLADDKADHVKVDEETRIAILQEPAEADVTMSTEHDAAKMSLRNGKSVDGPEHSTEEHLPDAAHVVTLDESADIGSSHGDVQPAVTESKVDAASPPPETNATQPYTTVQADGNTAETNAVHEAKEKTSENEADVDAMEL